MLTLFVLVVRGECWALQGGGSADEEGGEDEDLDDDTEGESSALKAAGNIFIAVVGAGVLGLPYAFAKSGVLLGAGFLVFVASLALYAMLLLAQCKRCGRNIKALTL